MADPPSSPVSLEPKPTSSEPENPNPKSNQLDPLPVPSSSSASSTTASAPAPVTVNPNSNPPIITPPPPSIPSYAPPPISGGAVVHPTAPSFRPAPPQFSPLLNPNFHNPGVQPPGVNPVSAMVPGLAGGAGSVSVSPMMHYQAPPGQPPNPAMRPYAPMPNGYPAMPMPAPQGTIPPPGVLRYPSPYTTMVRPAFPLRPPGAIGMLPVLSRPPVPGIHGVRPMIPPAVRPSVIPSVTPTEKPQTTVYVGKISPTVENDFMLSLLRLCGPVKSWKRAQDPTDGTPRGFGFCEFETAEGVLRALRLLSKLNVDGQELVLNVNQATREYLERYVEKKTENSKKIKETEAEVAEKEEESAPGPDKNEPPKPSVEELKKDDDDIGNKENHDTANFGIVTDDDREADREASEKLTSMMEERLKTKPLPPPPAQAPGDVSGNSNSEMPTKSKDGDSDVDIMRNDAVEDKNDDDTTSENKLSEHDRPETSSPDRSRRYDRRSRDRDNRERDLKREKEREFERLERETQRERDRKERERERKIQEAERAEREYKERVREWESREREREKQRLHEKEREKERERKRKKEIKDDESDDDDSRKRLRRSVLEEKRRKRLREREDDLSDRLKEEDEIAEAKKRADEERQQQQQKDALKLLSVQVTNGSEKTVMAEETNVENKDEAVEPVYEGDSGHGNHIGDRILQNGTGDESTMATITSSDTRQNNNAPARKLGFGLVGSGKRTAVPSVFYEEEDDDARNEKKMRPLVPIDYSTEELEAVQPANTGAAPPNLVAAAEFAKRISHVNPKEEKPDGERERSRRSHDRTSHRDKDRNDEDINRTRDENREKILDRDKDREHGLDKLKTPENKKLLDAKQLIDMIPKTKEELFSYEINWAVYDKHELHERMRPWISKKITEFLGEEETTLVDYIVSSTHEHVKATQMLELLQSILDDEAEMFVLKMWRMLIFEIKKVETGLSLRSKT